MCRVQCLYKRRTFGFGWRLAVGARALNCSIKNQNLHVNRGRRSVQRTSMVMKMYLRPVKLPSHQLFNLGCDILRCDRKYHLYAITSMYIQLRIDNLNELSNIDNICFSYIRSVLKDIHVLLSVCRR